MSNTFDKLSVLDSFIEEVNSYLPEIEKNLEKLALSPNDMDALEETYRRTHTIGGSASMMDFPGLAHVAHGMEDILGDALDGLTTLDEPTLGLLHRSLGRLHQLLEGIRNGIDEDAIIAEDDADYARYRAMVDASSEVPTPQATGAHKFSLEEMAPFTTTSQSYDPGYQAFGIPVPPTTPSAAPMPSFDEVLESFRTPSTSSNDDLAWPEAFSSPAQPVEPAPAPQPPAPLFTPPAQGQPTSSSSSSSSALEELMASMRSMPPIPPQTPFAVPPPSYEESQRSQPVEEETPGAPEAYTSWQSGMSGVASNEDVVQPNLSDLANFAQIEVEQWPLVPEQSTPANSATPTFQAEELPIHYASPTPEPAPAQLEPQYTQQYPPFVPESQIPQPASLSLAHAGSLPQSYEQAQREAQNLLSQVASLQEVIAQLRDSIEIIEEQRKEFRGFLDGSKDALDRMEDWAGRAMGLNLRNSPEQVRRYLPLSVMWVSNSKLKKVLERLKHISGGVETTDEQVQGTISQLQASIESCGLAFQQLQVRFQQAQNAPVFKQDAGWTPWEMQNNAQPETVRERVVFERQGDMQALRAEIAAQVREELEHEIREEMRREYESKAPQPSVSGSQANAFPRANESIPDLEHRLRNEIEIQVRQEFLSQISTMEPSALGGAPEAAAREAQASSPANFQDRARQSLGGEVTMPSRSQPTVPPQPQPSRSAPAPKPAPPAPAPAQSFGAEFADEAAEIFRMEAEEHLQSISVHVAALENDPNNSELIQGIRRAMHTLKGAAGMMGFRAIADLSHASEDLLDSIMEGTTQITSNVVSVILDTAETLDSMVSHLDASLSSDETRAQSLRARYSELLGGHTPSTAIEEDLSEYEDQPASDVAFSSSVVGEEEPITGELGSTRTARSDLNVRVRLQKLDELVNLFGELLVNRSVLEERIQRLMRLVADVGVSSNRLQDVGQKLESRFEAATLPSGRKLEVSNSEGEQGLVLVNNGMQRVPSHLAEFDELELDRYTEFHQLTRGLSEGISDMSTLSTEMEGVIRECENVFARENRLSTTFQDRLMKVRLVPLATMAPRLYRAARAVALKQGKDFQFLLEGEETEVDRTVFEEISGPLLHLMRNAVNHALDRPEVRQQKGKAPTGMIKLSAGYEGNQVVITVRDDGKGLDPDIIRQTAIERGLIRPGQPLSEGDVIDLIFRPGFSTAQVLSEESGRGVGLDVVRDSVSRLRGTLEVESAPGQGTAFTMKFPTSLAIQNAMMVRVANQQFAIPTLVVESIGRLDSFKRSMLGNQPAVLIRNELYPLHLLSQYLSLPASSIDDRAQLLIVNAGGHRMALIVDEIKGRYDIVMKNLGPHLRQVHGIAGATVLGNGQVVLILEMNNLFTARVRTANPSPVTSRQTAAQQPQAMAATVRQSVDLPKPGRATTSMMQPVGPVSSASAERGKHILVVDDSPSVRRVVGNMLKQHNWEIQVARDGVEALEMISQETPAAVLLDIEMPRMDGYELIATVRAQEQYRTLPLVVLTSRAATKHQQRAMQLGASAYVIKPYQDEDLLNTLNTLVYGAPVR
ncbi:hypothetical protein KSC_045590 [Ktedonobacter sp. SOSP1-52]|uniref:response regulator n=1 Tax=Ktedonobacter sp. SOSP1-52 TaxID=2778366 RepID=UPI0019168855|nr:response regulator [Ktedonobacter sp. SOSP1-52]GHO65667.1 hypothetical protein KSC_045590 [Ktedonobacter sp. SOSP1-52]